MNYEFPHIQHLNQIRAAIEGSDEFFIAERDWGYVVNYQVCFAATFPPVHDGDVNAAIKRECRGIKFNLNGDIIARPLHKFFNLGEKDETSVKSINWDQTFIILDKLDGSMIHPIMVDGQVRWCTKMGLTDTSAQAEAYIALNPRYNDFARKLMQHNITPIFEWCSRQQKIVVDYSQDQLVLIAARDMYTGAYKSHREMLEFGKQWDIPVVDVWGGEFADINSFVDEIQERTNEEGYVIRNTAGHMLKIKNLWYLQLHKTKELLSHEKDVWRLIVSNNHDDAKAIMDENDKARIDAFAMDLIQAINNTADLLVDIVTLAVATVGNDRKRFALEVVPQHKKLSSLLFRVFNGYDAHAVVRDTILKGTGSGPRLEVIRHLGGGLNWNDY